MKIFVSGATGFIGSRLALRLAEQGHQVHALYRSLSKTSVIKHPNITLFQGDILDYDSLVPPLAGCSQVYHTAAFAGVWHKDLSMIYRLNIEGTLNVLRAGINAGVKRMVCTSTAGVLGPSDLIDHVDEYSSIPKRYFVDYESSKAILEQLLMTFSLTGPEIVIVNPTRVYGPGVLSESNGVTRMIARYIIGKWRMIPGDGNSIGNYVFVEDVVTGLILAMEKGISGERYVLGGSNLTYNELFDILSILTGKKYLMFHIPIPFMLMISGLLLSFATITGGKPLITPSLVRKFNHQWKVSSTKAENELDYHPIDFMTGARETLNWLLKKQDKQE
jgi:nucleoside-diphosphate-sugar epimerase